MKQLFLSCVCALSFALPISAQSFGANDVEFLNLVGALEGPGGFSDVYGGVPFYPPKPLESMTIKEVLAYQEEIRDAQTISSAVARYQFIHATLKDLVAEMNLHPDLVFDSEVQTFLARQLMSKCGFYDPQTPTVALGNCLATIWAALPVMSGPKEGQSVYQGLAGNKALISPLVVSSVLDDRFSW